MSEDQSPDPLGVISGLLFAALCLIFAFLCFQGCVEGIPPPELNIFK